MLRINGGAGEDFDGVAADFFFVVNGLFATDDIDAAFGSGFVFVGELFAGGEGEISAFKVSAVKCGPNCVDFWFLAVDDVVGEVDEFFESGFVCVVDFFGFAVVVVDDFSVCIEAEDCAGSFEGGEFEGGWSSEAFDCEAWAREHDFGDDFFEVGVFVNVVDEVKSAQGFEVGNHHAGKETFLFFAGFANGGAGFK